MIRENQYVELLAPAGDYDSFIAACKAGCNAVYMGLNKYNARNMAKNFDIDKYIECIKYAHVRGIKVYLTLNTLLDDSQIKEAIILVISLYYAGLDAVIVQDLGMAITLHKVLPDLALHASTQMSVYSLEQVQFLEKIGFKRVVLARELSIEEIEKICKNSNIEIEVFVHGALCVSLSGQCLLSSTIGQRSANRGSCAQTCRMKYKLYNCTDRKIENNGTYILSKKDIYGIELLEKLINAGVTSLKIEGRNKSKEYVTGTVLTYRRRLDDIKNNVEIKQSRKNSDKAELMQLFNRNGLSSGYLDGVKFSDSITLMSPKNTGIFLGTVITKRKNLVKVRLDENISLHDGIEIYTDEDIISNIVTCIKDKTGNLLNKDVEKDSIVWLGDVHGNVKAGSKVYKTSSSKLKEKYHEFLLSKEDYYKKSYDISIKIKENETIKAFILNEFVELEVIPEKAQKVCLTKKDVEIAFEKTGDLPCNFNIVNLDISENIFVPISTLNELRRCVFKKVFDLVNKQNNVIGKIEKLDSILEETINHVEKYTAKNIVNYSNGILYIYEYNQNRDYFCLYKEKFGEKLNCLYINVKDFVKYEKHIFENYVEKNVQVYIVISNMSFENEDNFIKENLERLIKNGIKGIVLGSFKHMELSLYLKTKYNIVLVADYSFNVTNLCTLDFLFGFGFDRITLLPEQNSNKLNLKDSYNNIEVVDDFITVMTSRYCILGSFIARRKNNEKCSRPCRKSKYVLKDICDKSIYIVCNDLDCIMRLVKHYYCKDNNYGIKRNCVLN